MDVGPLFARMESMPQVISKLSTHRRRSAMVAVLLASIAANTSGCGIPKLRSPQAGPTLPSSYLTGTNWNRGAVQVPEGTTTPMANPSSSSPDASQVAPPQATPPSEPEVPQAPADSSSTENPDATGSSDKTTSNDEKIQMATHQAG